MRNEYCVRYCTWSSCQRKKIPQAPLRPSSTAISRYAHTSQHVKSCIKSIPLLQKSNCSRGIFLYIRSAKEVPRCRSEYNTLRIYSFTTIGSLEPIRLSSSLLMLSAHCATFGADSGLSAQSSMSVAISPTDIPSVSVISTAS
mgnify:CR=1 FL=1